jgi:hypothetical protein
LHCERLSPVLSVINQLVKFLQWFPFDGH